MCAELYTHTHTHTHTHARTHTHTQVRMMPSELKQRLFRDSQRAGHNWAKRLRSPHVSPRFAQVSSSLWVSLAPQVCGSLWLVNRSVSRSRLTLVREQILELVVGILVDLRSPLAKKVAVSALAPLLAVYG